MGIRDLIDYCNNRGLSFITIDELTELLANEDSQKRLFPNEVTYDNETEKAIDYLCEVMASHRRDFSKFDQMLIETGVLSGRCYVCWHENKYYPGATVDNLKAMGFSKFYDKYKSNWEKIKSFRKELIKNGSRGF